MTVKIYDLAKVTTPTTGTTSPLALGSAVSGFLSFAAAGASDGETVRYAIRDGANTEVGYGVIGGSVTTLTRNVTSSTNSNAAISLSGSAQVFISALKADIETIPIGKKPTSPSGSVGVFALANVVPQMTSNNSAGAISSASSTYGGGDGSFGVFTNKRNATTGWITNASQTGWVKIQLPAAKTIYGYSVVGWSIDTWNGRCPKSWTLDGSNDGTNWTTLDTRTNVDQNIWIRWVERFFPLSAPATYLHYRINITANYSDAYMGLSQLILYGEIDPPEWGFSGLFMVTPAGEIVPLTRQGFL